MIERLILKDFKSHKDSDIKFYPSLNVFLGEVGAGKTSVLEAISFALFGKYAGNVAKNELIRRGTKNAEISLVFSTNLDKYKVNRKIYSKKRQEAKLLILEESDWKLVVEGATAVSRSIEDLLDVDSATFLAATYASQSEIKEMLETQPGKRRERLDKLLGIDTYEKIWNNLGDVRTVVLDELTEAQEKASGFAILERQINNLNVHLKKNKQELKMLTSFLREIEDRLQPAKQQLNTLQNLEQRLNQLETQIKGKDNEIKNSSATLKSLKEKIEKTKASEKAFKKNKRFIQLEKDLEQEKRLIETVLQQKSILETFVKRDNDTLKEILKRRGKVESQLEALSVLESRLKTLKEEKELLPELKEKQADLEKKLNELKEEAVKAFTKIENQKRKAERVAELGECPTCLQIVPEGHKEKIRRETGKTVIKLKTEYDVIQKARNHVQKLMDNLKKKIELAMVADKKYARASGQIKMLKGCREEMTEINVRIEGIKSSIGKNRKKINEINETPETLMKVTEKLHSVSAKAEVAKKAEKQMAAKKDLEAMFLQDKGILNDLQLQLKELKSSFKETAEKYDPNKHRKQVNAVEILQKNQAKTTEGIERLKKSIEEDVSRIKLDEKQLKEKGKAWKQVKKLKKESAILEILRKSLREVVQPVMRKNNVLKVSHVFQGFYQELSNDNIDYAAIDEEGNIDVTRNGEPSPVNSLSGGETTCAALALRLAICSSLTKNQLLLLDEPTIHLDELYRAKLREFLGSHNFEQLIVVTHDNTFDSLPAHIFKVEKRRGKSVVSSYGFEGGA